ncbi:hypothetical protein BdWA1_002627 [Babesia duncani]|uniref:Uncharacterized protein n=1 Tax=Babesia duncani TaxID=323732 RepID=A0AAD9UNL4_9APIC|nr:hypothetical protein BdWA1_002627 [Babesia duncani]
METDYFKTHRNSIPGFGGYKPDEPWKRAIARNAGFYEYPKLAQESDNSMFGEGSTDRFAALLKAENPRSSCTPILVEEHKCLHMNDYCKDPERAASKCVKWYQEWMQCKWDEERLKFGYNYLEDLPIANTNNIMGRPSYMKANLRRLKLSYLDFTICIFYSSLLFL